MNIYAFYLPQFYITEENNKWWGEGFTDWIPCKKAKVLFDGHYQPRVPLDENYYNLLNKETMRWQSKLMNEFGIDGICMYHYWFGNGNKALEKPAENLLGWKDININYCFYWDNSPWVRSWSAIKGVDWVDSENDKMHEGDGVLLPFAAGREKEWEKHFEYLCPFFHDERYIKIDGMPVFMIFQPQNLGCLHEMVFLWNNLAKKEGFKGIYFIGRGDINRKLSCLNAVLYHEPHHSAEYMVPTYDTGVRLFSYDDAIKCIGEYKLAAQKIYYSCFTDCDNSPRKGKTGMLYSGSTPEKFYEMLKTTLVKNKRAKNEITFVNAWNEWGEGMYLEPDVKNGFLYLRALKRAKEDYLKEVPLWSDSFYDKQEIANIEKNSKYETYFNKLSDWMIKIQQGRNILDFLEKNSIRDLIIYGKGIFSSHFLLEIANDERFTVVGFMDRNDVSNEIKTRYIKIGDELPKCDAIIVTSFYYIDEIADEIRRFYDTVRIFSIEELIDEV